MSQSRAVSKSTSEFRPLDTTSVLRPARLNCPECQRQSAKASLLESCSAGQRGFHRCKLCGGVWFLDLGVDEALEAVGSQSWNEPLEAKIAGTESDMGEGGWACPCCRGALVGVKDRHGSGAVVRRCLVCYGGWIEFDGLKKAAAASHGLLSSMGRFMSGLLSR